MKKVGIIVIAIILVIVGIVVFNRGRNSQKTTEKTFSVQKTTMTIPLTLSGEIKAKEQTTVRFASAGKIASLNVQNGDIVTKGQLLASLDQRELQLSLKKLLNSYMTSRWTFEQTKSDNQSTAELGASQLIRERAKRIVDQAQFSLDNSVLDVEAKALSIEFANLISPMSGIIIQVPQMTVGTNITTPTQAEFIIVSPDSLYFEALADQTEITSLSENQSASIFLDSFPDATLSGTIKTLSFAPVTGEVGTVYAIDITLPPSSNQYRLGMTGDVTFITQQKEDVLVVPSSFITNKDGKQFVQVKQDGKLLDREVSIGLENDTEVEILSGLSSGEVIYD